MFGSSSREVRAYGASDLILHDLLRLKSLPLIPSSDFSSYLNPDSAKRILLHEIHHHSYGRISVNELQVRILYCYIFLISLSLPPLDHL
jgi:hypothetical protein